MDQQHAAAQGPDGAGQESLRQAAAAQKEVCIPSDRLSIGMAGRSPAMQVGYFDMLDIIYVIWTLPFSVCMHHTFHGVGVRQVGKHFSCQGHCPNASIGTVHTHEHESAD